MAYKFSLAAVLQLRELVAEQEERTLARLQAEIETLRQARLRTLNEIAQTARARESTLQTAGGLSAMHLHSFYAAETSLRARLSQIDEQTATFTALREKQLRIWDDARQKQETLESLRDEEAKKHRAEMNRVEQKLAEESFLMRSHLRRRPIHSANLAG